jgi:hypothetical protein
MPAQHILVAVAWPYASSPRHLGHVVVRRHLPRPPMFTIPQTMALSRPIRPPMFTDVRRRGRQTGRQDGALLSNVRLFRTRNRHPTRHDSR